MTQHAVTRKYRSEVRAEQMELTRGRLVEAALQFIIEHGDSEELSLARIALAAGVAVPTAYRHFPKREDLILAAYARVESLLWKGEYPSSVEALPAFARELFGRFDLNEAMVRAAESSRLTRAHHTTAQKVRANSLRKTLAPVTHKLPPLQRTQVESVFRSLASSRTWKTMRDSFGLTGEQAGDAVGWAMRVLLAELEKSPTRLKG